MEVICKGYDTCDERLECEHSTPHKLKNRRQCEKSEHNLASCYCSHVFLRKQKLDKLNECNLQNK